jgi:hypothetical protein
MTTSPPSQAASVAANTAKVNNLRVGVLFMCSPVLVDSLLFDGGFDEPEVLKYCGSFRFQIGEAGAGAYFGIRHSVSTR